MPRERRAGAQRCRVEHEPFFDARVSGDGSFERWIQLGQRHLGQESQAAEVDAEDGNAGARFADAIRHREQRAVAAEHQHHVDLVDQRALVRGAAIRRRVQQRGRCVLEHGHDAACFEPGRDLNQMRRRVA